MGLIKKIELELKKGFLVVPLLRKKISLDPSLSSQKNFSKRALHLSLYSESIRLGTSLPLGYP